MNHVDTELIKAFVVAIDPIIQRAIKPMEERLDNLERELRESKVETRERFDAIDNELDGLVKYAVQITKDVQTITESQAVIEYCYDSLANKRVVS